MSIFSREANGDPIAEVRNYWNPIVHNVRIGVKSGLLSGIHYAEFLSSRVYDVYANAFARYGDIVQTQLGTRDAQQELLEEGLQSPPRAMSDPLPCTVSPPATPSHDPHDLGRRALQFSGQILRRQQKLSRAEAAAAKRRVEATQHRHFFLTSLGSLEKTIQEIVQLVPPPDGHLADPARLEQLIALLREDVSRVQTDNARVREDDSSMLALDDTLKIEASKFVQTANSFSPTTVVLGNTPRSESQSSTASNSHRSLSPVPSLITRYLDQRGDVQIFKERLHNFIANHLVEQQEREFQREQDHEPEVSDEVFEQQYLDQREEMKHELALAEQELTDLEVAATRQGLDTTFAVRRSFGDDSEPASPLGGPWQIIPDQDVSSWMNVTSPLVEDGVPVDPNTILPKPSPPMEYPPAWTL